MVNVSVSGPDVVTRRAVRVEPVASMRSHPVVAPPGELVPEHAAHMAGHPVISRGLPVQRHDDRADMDHVSRGVDVVRAGVERDRRVRRHGRVIVAREGIKVDRQVCERHVIGS
jgi:hypothetical protein